MALDRVLVEVELLTEITDFAFERNQANLDGRSALGAVPTTFMSGLYQKKGCTLV